MATAARSRLLPAGALAAALAIAGCGGAATSGWKVGRLPSGAAAVSYPTGWHTIRTDPGTFSAALLGSHGRIQGYLNLTPRSGAETLANWSTFRVDHNRDEGDRHVVRESSAVGVRFRSGTGSCVTDRYATTTSAHYREIACIVRGPHGTTVIVAAAPPSEWQHVAPQLRRSLASFAA